MPDLTDTAESCTHNIRVTQEGDIQGRKLKTSELPDFACLRLEGVHISSNNLLHYLALSQYHCACSVMGFQG